LNDKYNFYEILNISNPCVNPALAEEQFKKYSIISHPDKFDSDKDVAVKRFLNICLAYLILNNNQTAEKYLNYRYSCNSEKKLELQIDDLEEEIKLNTEKADKFSSMSFKEFVMYLKNELKIISVLNAQTAIGLHYEYLDFKFDKKTIDIYIDPEEIKPNVSLIYDILRTYIKIVGITLIIFTIFYIIGYIRS